MYRLPFILFAVSVIVTVGCRQPVTGPQARQPLFNFQRPNVASLFGNNARNNPNDRQLAQNSGYPGASRFGGFNANSLEAPSIQIPTNTPQEYQAYSNLSSQINNLNHRVGAYDADNQQLHTELAGLKQKLQLANDYNQQLKQQLSDTSGQFQQLNLERGSTEQQLAAMRFQYEQKIAQLQNQITNTPNQLAQYRGSGAPTRLAGAATVRANNSLMSRLSAIQIPGGNARMDGDVIRIEFPSDRMFVPGTYQIQAAQQGTMQNLVSTIQQTFPQQIVGVESHWDGTPLNPPGTTDHQLTATQALAVLNEAKRLGLPENQLFTMAMGSNRPRHPQGQTGGIRANRRIEIVIYPETFDGS